jgi:hypothetical protein
MALTKKARGIINCFRPAIRTRFSRCSPSFKTTHKLIDFNIAWVQGSLLYSGYWLANAANASPAGQMLVWDLSFNDLLNQWKTLSAQGLRMTRVQAFPQDAGAAYSALFAPSNASYTFFGEAADTFFTDVNGKYAAESLAGIAFDPTSGNMLGCWLGKVTPSEFVSNENWDTLTATAQKASAGGMVLSAMAAYPNAPSFDDFFEANEAPFVEGYAYAVALNGNVIAAGNGFARSPHETVHPNLPYTPDVRMNLASVSKAITGMALEVLLQQNPMYTLDTPFWPLIQNKVPTPDPSVKTVTLKNLAEMMSGMVQEPGEGPLNPPAPYTDIWSFLNFYLSQPLHGHSRGDLLLRQFEFHHPARSDRRSVRDGLCDIRHPEFAGAGGNRPGDFQRDARSAKYRDLAIFRSARYPAGELLDPARFRRSRRMDFERAGIDQVDDRAAGRQHFAGEYGH